MKLGGMMRVSQNNKARNSLSPRDKGHLPEGMVSAWSPLWLNILRSKSINPPWRWLLGIKRTERTLCHHEHRGSVAGVL